MLSVPTPARPMTSSPVAISISERSTSVRLRTTRPAEPGTRWNYSTGETQVVAALVAAATGKTLADYLSQKIWAKFGMESDATWWLESPEGLEIGGSGLSATLRDYARFGLFLLNGGIAGGEITRYA